MPQAPATPSTVSDSILIDSLNEQLGLVRFEESEVRAILEILVASYDDLELQLRRSLDRRRPGDPVLTRLRLIKRELELVMNEAYGVLRERVESGLAPLGERVVASHAAAVERAVPFALSLTRPDPELLRAIATKNPFSGRLLSDHIVVAQSSAVREVLLAIQIGMTQGESNDRIVRRVMGTGARFSLDGALAVQRRQASHLVRTAVQHVHGEARDQLYSQNLDILSKVMAVATLDSRTCRICQPRDGRVWTLPDHRPVGHRLEWLAGPGRWHMLCRCSSIPVLRSSSELEDQGFDLGDLTSGERAAVDGPVSNDTVYEDWLRSQRASVQDRVLGPRRAAWWRSRSSVSLSQAWSQRFGGVRVDPSTLDEALPLS